MSNYSSLFRVLSPSRVQTKFKELPASHIFKMRKALTCFVMGEFFDEFTIVVGDEITIDGTSVPIKDFTVDLLKKHIWKDISKKFEGYGIEPSELNLWKAEIPISEENDEILKNPKIEDIIQAFNLNNLRPKKLRPGNSFLDKSVFPDDYAPPQDHIHILVQPPSSPATTESPSKRRKLGEDDIKLQRIWKAFKTTPENFNDPFLRFSEEVSYLFGKDDQNKNITTIFIRKIYHHLSNIILERADTRHFLITGNPGIGKTFFGYYLLYKLARQNKMVVYHKHDKSPVFFSDNYVYSHYEDNIYAFRDILADEDVWYVVDGRRPADFIAKTILISSPQKSNYKTFSKIGTTIQYMPVWSWKETETCRAELFPELSQNYVWELYNRWGGIPRYILFYATNESQQCQLDKEINSVNDSILNYLGESADDNCASHKIVHIYTNELQEEEEGTEETEDNPSPSKTPAVAESDKSKLYTKTILKFASDYVSEKVMDILIKNFKDRLLDFVKASSAINDYATLRGTIFERLAHRRLLKGGTFNVRPLIKDTVTESDVLPIPERKKLIFSDINDIKPDSYCIPTQKNKASFDAYVSPDTFFQMTIAEDHPILRSGLENYIDKNSNSEIKFYFVVPKELFSSYTEQNLHGVKKRILQNKPKWFPRFKQYAIEFDLKL